MIPKKIIFSVTISIILFHSISRIWNPIKHLGHRRVPPSCEPIPPHFEVPKWDPYAILNIEGNGNTTLCVLDTKFYTSECLVEVQELRNRALEAQTLGSTTYKEYQYNVDRALCFFIMYGLSTLKAKDKCRKSYHIDFAAAGDWLNVHYDTIQYTLCQNHAKHSTRRLVLDGYVVVRILQEERSILFANLDVFSIKWTWTASSLSINVDFGLSRSLGPRMKALYAFLHPSPAHWSRYVTASLNASTLTAELAETRALGLQNGSALTVRFSHKETFTGVDGEMLYGITPLQLNLAGAEFLMALLALYILRYPITAWLQTITLALGRWVDESNEQDENERASWVDACKFDKMD